MAGIADRKRKREVDAGQQLHEDEVPAREAWYEDESSSGLCEEIKEAISDVWVMLWRKEVMRERCVTYDIQVMCQTHVPVCELPARAGQQLEADREGQEDHHEDDVGPEAADEIHEAEDAPEEVVECWKERKGEEMLCQFGFQVRFLFGMDSDMLMDIPNDSLNWGVEVAP